MTTPSTAYKNQPLNFNGVSAPLNFKYKQLDVVLQNGDNDNIARGDANYLRVTGPSSAFSISGFDSPLSGIPLVVQIAVTQTLTIKNQTRSQTKFQIYTGTGADVTISDAPRIITFIYDPILLVWSYIAL